MRRDREPMPAGADTARSSHVTDEGAPVEAPGTAASHDAPDRRDTDANTESVTACPAVQITFKLYAMLGDYLPAEHRRANRMPLDLPAGATIAQAIEPFQLPPKLVHLVLVNGRYVAPADRADHVLADGDVLAIWPPIAGG